MAKKEINEVIFNRLFQIGVINKDGEIPTERTFNNGASDYASNEAILQPWAVIKDHNLDYCDGDIIKRVLRSKPGERVLDYKKIIHICQEQIREILALDYIADEQSKKEVVL